MYILANYAVTLALTGFIWVIQLVKYPAFHLVGDREFPQYHRHHTHSITLIVLPLMLTELGLGIFMASRYQWHVDFLLPLLLLTGIWMSTFLIQIPLHRKLEAGKDEAAINRLVRSNWIRTFLWTAKGVWLTQFML